MGVGSGPGRRSPSRSAPISIRKAPKRAYDIAGRVLAELDMLPEGRCSANSSKARPHAAAVGSWSATMSPRSRPTSATVRHFANFDPVEPGEIIGEDGTGAYRAPMIDNPVIFMPAAEATLRDDTNTDAFFFGVEVAHRRSRTSDTSSPKPPRRAAPAIRDLPESGA